MAENTDWFEGLTAEGAREERIIFWVWVTRLGVLLAVLCTVAYATSA